MTMTRIPQPFLKLLKRLLDEHIDFLVVGGWAVITHGYVRYTKDFDLWMVLDPSEAGRVYRVLEEVGFKPPIDAPMILQIQPSVLRLGSDPVRLDIMSACDGCDWPSAWNRRLLIDLDGLQVPILSLRDLRAAKRAAGRHRDLDDLENLPPVEGEDDVADETDNA